MVEDLSKKIIVTTSWDDVSYENLKMIRLLDEFKVFGTFYINLKTDNTDRNLSQAQVKEIVIEVTDSGHEVGSHTVSHATLTKCKNPREEIERSKYELEKLTGEKLVSFCYPNGAYDDRIKSIVRETGYLCARTCGYKGIGFPEDPYEWGITLHASNGSPLTTFKIWRESGISWKSLLDWEIRAKFLFDLVLEKGGLWHLWGHSWEIESNKDWSKLARVLQYVANKEGVLYWPNGKIFEDLLLNEETHDKTSTYF